MWGALWGGRRASCGGAALRRALLSGRQPAGGAAASADARGRSYTKEREPSPFQGAADVSSKPYEPLVGSWGPLRVGRRRCFSSCCCSCLCAAAHSSTAAAAASRGRASRPRAPLLPIPQLP